MLASNNLTVYIITGESEKDIVKQFRKMVGRSYIPPFWAFGYGQSRWGYKTEEDIRTVAKTVSRMLAFHWTAFIWILIIWNGTRILLLIPNDSRT